MKAAPYLSHHSSATLSLLFCSFITFAVVVKTQSEFTCGGRIVGTTGTIIVNRNANECELKSEDNTTSLYFSTRELDLKDGEKLEITSADGNPISLVPPFEIADILIGRVEPVLKFYLGSADNSSFRFGFSKAKRPQLPKIELTHKFSHQDAAYFPESLPNTTLAVNRSSVIKGPTHLYAPSARFPSGSRHELIKSDQSIQIRFDATNNYSLVSLAEALQNCSDKFDMKAENQRVITLPNITSSFRCVNLISLVDNSHYEIQIQSNPVSRPDDKDELLIDDGTETIRIDRSNYKQHLSKTTVLTGKNLSIIYDSPQGFKATPLGLKIIIKTKLDGGVLNSAGPLKFTTTSNPRFVLKPPINQVAVVEVSATTFVPENSSLIVYEDDRQIAKFGPQSQLPPNLSATSKNSSLILDFNGISFATLNNLLKFQPSTSSCHRLSQDRSGQFSVQGEKGTNCTFSLTSFLNKIISFNVPTYSPPVYVTISQFADLKKQSLFKSYNVTFPKFVMRQAFISISFPQNRSVIDVSFSPAENNTILPLDSNLSSPSYPSNYPVFLESQTLVVDGMRKNIVVNPDDLDIRSHEKLTISGNQINDLATINSIIVQNATRNININRQQVPTDFELHRGYKFSIRSFDEIWDVDSKKTTFSIGKNVSSAFVRISYLQRTYKADKFAGKRIIANVISSAPLTSSQLQIYDSRSLKPNHLMKVQNASTSDTVLIVLSDTKPLPDITIKYSFLDCKPEDLLCDSNTRCVPLDQLCNGLSLCDDGKDLKYKCTAPEPKLIPTGISGGGAFFLSIFMLAIGALSAIYGPGLYKLLEDRYRAGRYSSFTSAE